MFDQDLNKRVLSLVTARVSMANGGTEGFPGFPQWEIKGRLITNTSIVASSNIMMKPINPIM